MKVFQILVFTYLSMFMLGLADNIRGPLFPEITANFSLSNLQSSFFFAVTSLLAFFASLYSLRFLKSKSLFQLMSLSILSIFIALFLIGFSTSFMVILIGAFFLGISFGGLGVSQNLLVTEGIPIENRARALSGLHSIYGLSSLLAPLLAAGAALTFSNWRAAFFLVGGIAFCLFLFFEYSQRKWGFHRAESAKLVIPTAIEKSSQLPLPVLGRISVSGLFAFYVVAEILISTRLALYMRESFGMNLQESSLYVTYFFIFLFLGRIFFAFFSFKGSTKIQMNISLVSSFTLFGLGLLVHPFLLALVGLAMAPYYPLSVNYISQNTNRERDYLTLAMAIQSLSVVAMHLGAGYLTDIWGVKTAFSIGMIALFVSFVCLNLHPKELDKIA